ncbi:hypothetical protein [Rhizobium terrae]|uniref:hypothetical protein n=1 Tax=Rhizobium terrae TaxID=2171756 RepID=UPI000E3EB7B4|nr:hypothetical protein [Rhizobium terrae]
MADGAPAVWAVNMQLGQMLPYVDCRRETSWTLTATFAAAFLAAAGALSSSCGHAVTVSRMMLFISRLSALVGFAFAFPLLLQGAATLLLSACER